MRILIASYSRDALNRIAAEIKSLPSFEVATRLLGNGHGDNLVESKPRPDLLLMHLDEAHRDELERLTAVGTADRPPLVVTGSRDDSELMRAAIRCGALDFLPEPITAADVEVAIERLRPQLKCGVPASGQTTVLFGAAGGVGTSFLAANLAHRYATDGERTILVDLDLVCAPLLSLFDLDPALGLIDALAVVDGLDPQALEGYVGRHRSGLQVLGATGDGLVFDGDVAADRLTALLRHLGEAASHVVVDAGSRLTPLTLAAAGSADRIALVVQQSVGCVRSAVRLKRILERDRGMRASTLAVVVNRYQRSSAVTEEDIRRALGSGPPLLVPNDYKAAHESCETGVPLIEVAGHAPLTKSMAALAASLVGREPRPPRSLFARALPIFSRRSS